MILFWVKEMVPHREVSARRPGKAPCSCSTDPLVTSATYILFTADQKGIFHGSAFIGIPYFPEIISQFCDQGKKMGVIAPSGCPSRLCARLYVGFKAGDTEMSGPCVFVGIYEQPVQLPGSQGLCVCLCQMVSGLHKILPCFCTFISSL